MEEQMDLYTDFLISTVGQATGTGLSLVSGGVISHDQVSRLLSKNSFDSKALWLAVKTTVRSHENEEGCLVFDDMVAEKAYTDENDLICWHWDHSKGRSVKGINLLTAFYHTQGEQEELPLRVPISFSLITKPIKYRELKTCKEKRKSEKTKNELMREMITQSLNNQLKFKYVLADSWFASAENMRFIHKKNKTFIFDMKTNRKAALTDDARNEGQWTRIDELDIPDNTPVKVWLKDLEIPILLTKQNFTNKDGSTGVRFLVSNDLNLSDDQFTTLYKKRWSVEEYHKSLKQNAAFTKSPTRTIKTQKNHFFASILAYVKLEKLKFVNGMNHFALKAKIQIEATKAAIKELNQLKFKLARA